MFRKTMLAISTGLVFGLSGCGDGGDGDPLATTGTAYYVDSAVSGVKYACGDSEGITDASGKFTFEVGQDCTFFLGNIKLRDVDKDILNDGVTVYETNKYRAQILQSLDSDGNPDNGITVSEELVTALEMADITTLPETEAETTVLLDVIESSGGTIVSETDAQSHSMTSLLSDRTLYLVNPEGTNDQDIDDVFFNSNGLLEEGGEETADNWFFDGDKLYTDTDGGYHQVKSITTDYILFEESDASEDDTRGYFEKSKAEAFKATLSEGIPNQYTVFGGNTYFSGGLSAMPTEYIELGKGTGTTTFNGSYEYYAIVNQNSSAIYIDAAEGSNGVFYGTGTTSNTSSESGDTWPNLAGSPDNIFMSIGVSGYALINASNDSLTSLTVVGK